MKDLILLYDDKDIEVIYFLKEHRILLNKDSTGWDYLLNDTNEMHQCYEHIMTIIKDKRYADCICECISAIFNDWFEDYVQMPGYNDIKNHILDMNNEKFNK